MSERPQSGVERLPEATRTQLRSTQILTSLPQIVSELVQNSLDANANQVDVGLDCKEWMCWVRDDGHGIGKDGLERLALGDRYNTSKDYAPDLMNSASTFGFRGEALASAAEISCLEICSRTSKSRNTWSIILKGSKQLYIGPAVRWKRESPGTAVCVRDAFYNLPVRRLSHPAPTRTWELARQEIETYSLMFPHVSFTLEDTNRSGEGNQNKDRTVRIPKTASTLDAFRHLFGSAMTEHVEVVDVVFGSIKIDGFISLTGASSRIYQFLYINRHPVDMSDLGRTIDSQFALSSFGKNALDEEGEKDMPLPTIRRSPRKIEKKAVYVLNITIAAKDVDNCLDPSKTVIQLRDKSSVLAALSETVQAFLQKHGFLNQNSRGFGQFDGSPYPRKRKRLDYQRPDDSGFAEESSIARILELSFEDEPQAGTRIHSVDLYTSTEGPREEILWFDQATGERFVVDSQTGHSFRQTGNNPRQLRSLDSQFADGDREGRRTLRQQKTKNTALTNSGVDATIVPAWLERALESNRAYPVSENRIPSVQVPPALDQSAPRHGPFRQSKDGCHHLQKLSPLERSRFDTFDLAHDAASQRFSKDDLRHAQVISQVDRKFIACHIARRSCTPPTVQGDPNPLPKGTLILIDQHAADERVRVERFLNELCLGFLESVNGTELNPVRGIRVRELTPPRPVLLTQHEALPIHGSPDVRTMLRKWGIRFVEPLKVLPESDGLSEPGSSTGYLQLLVSAIPEIVGDKLLQGDELRDFIKGFLGQIQSGELLPSSRLDFPPEADHDEFLWLKAVRYCPRGLLELVNSKACRGAIMFNDSLSVAQCERLVKQLSETAFPFQCAHGRPSLVPLVEIGSLRETTQERKIQTADWDRLETMEGV